jgi:hypothetical protein
LIPQIGHRVRHLGGSNLYKSRVPCPCAYLRVLGLSITILHRTIYYLGYPLGRLADLKHRQLACQVGVIITTGRIQRTNIRSIYAAHGFCIWQLDGFLSTRILVLGCKHNSSKFKSRAQTNNRNSPTPACPHHAIATSGSSCLARIRLAENSGTVTASNRT